MIHSPIENHRGAVRQRFRGTPEICPVLLLTNVHPATERPELVLDPGPVGSPGHRLQSRVLRLSPMTYLAMWRGALCFGQWDKWQARARAQELTTGSEHPWRIVVALGGAVSDALPTELEMRGITKVIRIGNPAASNSAYNHKAVRDLARSRVRDELPDFWRLWPLEDC